MSEANEPQATTTLAGRFKPIVMLWCEYVPRYRMIYVSGDSDPCKWQAQERVFLLFWKNMFGRVSSATTAANGITNMIMIRKKK